MLWWLAEQTWTNIVLLDGTHRWTAYAPYVVLPRRWHPFPIGYPRRRG